MIDDIPDKRVVRRVLEHGLGEADFLLVHCRWASTLASALSSRREAGLGVLDDQFTLKLVEGGRDMEEQPALGRFRNRSRLGPTQPSKPLCTHHNTAGCSPPKNHS